MKVPDQVWLESYRPGSDGRSYRFDKPFGEVVVQAPEDMAAAFDQVEDVVHGGDHVVVVIPYEAASAFDVALDCHRLAGSLPMAWFGLYEERHEIMPGEAGPAAGSFSTAAWQPRLDAAGHARPVGTIRDYVGAGHVYQVNFTFPVDAAFAGDPAALYRAMCRAQGGAAFCAYADFGEVAVLSASPELFFTLDAVGRIRTRPMKGTRQRGRWSAQDEARREALAKSAKDRAENLMIVDLLRSDLGRVAVAGSIEVTSLWDVEPYDTVWQMTSTINGQSRPEVGLFDLFAALFPCGSVTGAPKVRASQIIRELEAGPRGVYTGSIGFVSPCEARDERRLSGLEAAFNVAIRTVIVDRRAGGATVGVGGGITWDSEATAEYAECRDKISFLRNPRSEGDAQDDFELFETLLFESGSGYYLVERHLRRLTGSARYFGFGLDEQDVRRRLESVAAGLQVTKRVRLSLARDGTVATETVDVRPGPASLTAVRSAGSVDPEDVFLYHKTTRRAVYTDALAQATDAGADEVILRNRRDELTECAVGNLVVERDRRLITPPLECGLLPGTFRQELLDTGRIEEGVLTAGDLCDADAVYLINSVRRWVRLEVRPPADGVNESTQERISCTG
ncbi:MAG: aminodeoxychorismate synthase component I [Candidatus Latescibacterota bacterium]|nr:aminodeoxychorismate synthase component I [Candidatus Latescibacterota bacterium]